MSNATGGSSVVSSLSTKVDRVFDMGNERDIIALLRRIHLSTLSLEIKNELRDLVFSTRFGVPANVDAAMMATFSEHGFAISAPNEVVTAIADSVSILNQPPVEVAALRLPGLGFSRQTPRFAGAVQPTLPPVVLVPPVTFIPDVAPDTTEKTTMLMEEVLLVDPIKPSFPAASLEVTEVTRDTKKHIVPLAEAPVLPVTADETITKEPQVHVPAAVVAEVVPDMHIPEVFPAEVATSSVVAAVQEVVARASEIPLSERIAQIKREVNALVGNPVNLIDEHNDVGREYMNALLDAMKKSIGSTPTQEIERAMARLERAFVSVKQALHTEPVPPATTVPVIEVESADAFVAEAVPTPVDNAWSSATSVQTLNEESIAPPAMVRSINILPVLEIVPEPEEQAESISIARTMPALAVESEVAVVTETPKAFVSEAPVDAFMQPANEVITSAAKEKQLKELMEARKEAEAVTSAERAQQSANNPLMADEVTNGLHQLLSEWKLFKSSGIFGTGPSGYDHPLYQKIAQLTMAAVLAGRFEGATSDIKRSISDYMNGWRYEEGVQHEQGEFFEMYLRRVIRHILDNQVKK